MEKTIGDGRAILSSSGKVEVVDYFHVEIMIQSIVFNRLQELFEKKHLYQSVTIDVTSISEAIGRDTSLGSGEGGKARLQNYLKRIILAPWTFQSEFIIRSAPKSVLEGNRIVWDRTTINDGNDSLFLFLLPTISITCNFCKAILPHNSGFPGERAAYTNFSKTSGRDLGR
jgi:hypothetical protein